MRLLVVLFFATLTLSAAQPALRDGEVLVYRVGWGVFFHAGEIRIAARDVPTAVGGSQLQVITTTETKGVARVLYTFEGRAESLFDPSTGRLLSNVETSKAQQKVARNSVSFDYAKSTANYVNLLDSAKNVSLALPPGEPLDLIMSLVQTRAWKLKPGEQQDALVLFGDEFYELTIHAIRYEEVHTPMGDFNTLLLEPRMDKTPPKGMFKRGSAVSVWISQDERRLPVKFQVEFKFGAGIATLMNYAPPAGTQVAEHQPGAGKPADGKPEVAETKPDAKNPRS